MDSVNYYLFVSHPSTSFSCDFIKKQSETPKNLIFELF